MNADLLLPNNTEASKRWLKWLPAWHLMLSLAIALAIAFLVTIVWFPSPHHLLGGGMRLFWVMMGVDIVCGPLLTWILIKPHKAWRALSVDLVLIACLQWGALGYGVYALAHARPLAVVHEVDRFRVINYSDVPEAALQDAPAWFTPWGLSAPRMLGIRGVQGLKEKMGSVETAFQGVDAAQLPSRWQEYEQSRADVLKRARPLDDLRARYPMDAGRIDEIARTAAVPAGVLWLPLVARQSMEWVALIDPSTAAILGYLPLDGFF